MPQQLGGLVYLQTFCRSQPCGHTHPTVAALTLPLQTCSSTRPMLPGESKLHRMAFSGRLFPHHPASTLVSSTGPLTDIQQSLQLLECWCLFPDDSDHHFPWLGIRDSVTHPSLYKRAPVGCHTCPFFFPSLTSQHSFVCTKPT